MLRRPSLVVLAALALSSATAQDSLNVHKLFHWEDPSLPIGDGSLQNKYNEVWGYSANGREYALMGTTLGVTILDVTDATNTVVVDEVIGRFGGSGLVHRDMRVYADHMFIVCDEGPSSLQVVDLQYLPDSAHIVYDSNALFSRAHNIEIDSSNARMYTCGGSSQFSAYDISDPASPTLLVNCEAEISGWSSAVGYVHDCFVRDNIVWLNDQDALHVMDFTDPQAPVLLGALTSYPDQGYNHSGWMNDDGSLYVMADETHGSPLKFIDASDPSDLEIGTTVTTGIDPNSIAHNPFFHGDLVHVAYYFDGYWLWDATDHDQPQLLGYYDTSLEPHSNGYRGAWGVYPYLPSGNILVSDMQTGLWVLGYDAPASVATTRSMPAYRIAPTVSNGYVRINAFEEKRDPRIVDVFGSDGRIVRSTSFLSSSTELDLSDLSDGTYMIAVGRGTDRYTQRIIKTSR